MDLSSRGGQGDLRQGPPYGHDRPAPPPERRPALTTFRDDIEGLRALAILPILLYHVGLDALPGGFVGVDIFFVISGFLITSTIAKDLGEGRFTLGRFYARRIVRILPTLLIMLATVGAVGAWLLFPASLHDLGRGVVSSAGFVSNLHFWRTAHYFAPSSDLNPVLHTWSLSVEEQFYLVFPLFLLALRRTRVPVAAGLAAMTLASFALGLWLGEAGKGKTEFYMLPSRAWEMGLGAMIAVGFYPRLPAMARQVLAVAGLAGIVAATLIIRGGIDAAFPAPWGLLPCLGAVLLIAYGQSSLAGSLLALPPVRWIGRVSYSIYLWHWPIIAFYRVRFGVDLQPVESLGLILVSIAVGGLSYSLFERPFLRRYRATKPAHVLVLGFCAAGLVLACGLGLSAVSGWRRYDPKIEAILAYRDYKTGADYQYQFRPKTCFSDEIGKMPTDPHCLDLSNTRRNIVVAGDSLAAQYWRALALQYRGDNVIEAAAPSCRTTVDPVGTEACRAIANQVLGPMLDSGKIDTLILSGHWEDGDLPKLDRTLDRLRTHKVRVILVGPGPDYEGEFPELLARALLTDTPGIVTDSIQPTRWEMNRAMAALAMRHGVSYVSPYRLLCQDARNCRQFTPAGSPTHFDSMHLTLEESIEQVRRFPPL